MRKVVFAFLLLVAVCNTVSAQTKPVAELRRMFDYDRNVSLDARVVRVVNKNSVHVHDISYASAKGGRVTAYLILPMGKGKFPVVMFLHPKPGSRSSFMDEALALAGAGAASLLIDAPFSRSGESKRDFDPNATAPAVDRDIYVQTVVDLRRGVDLLSSRPEIDRERIGFVGHSFGAHAGALLAGVEKRIKAFVIMAGSPSLTEFLRTSTLPAIIATRDTLTREQQQHYFSTMAVVDPINYIPHVAPSTLLLQFGKKDFYPDEKSALDYSRVASEPKAVRWYDAGHDLNDEARHERATWLSEQLNIGKPKKTR